jgi:hypothetical protein
MSPRWPDSPKNLFSPLHCGSASLRENNVQTVFFKNISRRDAVTQGKNGEDLGEEVACTSSEEGLERCAAPGSEEGAEIASDGL